jgi:hypothetical protein
MSSDRETPREPPRGPSALSAPVLVLLAISGNLPGAAYWLIGWVVLEMVTLVMRPFAYRREQEVVET